MDYLDYFLLGTEKAAAGDYTAAIGYYTEALKLDPTDVVTLNLRGEVYLMAGFLDLAIRDFTEAIHWDPEFAEAYHNRSNAYAMKGQPMEAREDAEKASRLTLSARLPHHSQEEDWGDWDGL